MQAPNPTLGNAVYEVVPVSRRRASNANKIAEPSRLAVAHAALKRMNKVAEMLGTQILQLQRELRQRDRVISHLKNAIQDSEEMSERHSLTASSDSEIKTASAYESLSYDRSGESAEVSTCSAKSRQRAASRCGTPPASWSQAEAR